MAVYRCEVKTLNRASGRSAVAAAAYRAAERLRDEQANEGKGKVHDYRRRTPGVMHREVVAPKGAATWATQRGQLWNQAERAENRRNSVTAREVLVSLPHELDDAQRAELVQAFALGLVDRYGVAVDLAIHRPDRKGDDRNHHAHLLMTTRRIGPEGFTEKTRELDDMKNRGPVEIEAIREMWEREQNRALQRAGIVERVSRLSNEARGIDREPQPKLGETATALMRRGEPSRLADRWQQVVKGNAKPGRAPSPMRQNMARQAEQRRKERETRLAQAHQPGGAVQRALQAAQQVRPPAPQGPTHIAEALMRSTSEAQQGEQDKQQALKDEARKLDEQRAKAGELEAARAWERQRQAELRRKRIEREQAQQNEQDPGRQRTLPGPKKKPD
ncbi:conjugal transfer protein TraA [Pelomonas sp. HMWF004]|nr:conjugal transfer protein TraA [Pelomonas sp. HMWF004]